MYFIGHLLSLFGQKMRFSGHPLPESNGLRQTLESYILEVQQNIESFGVG